MKASVERVVTSLADAGIAIEVKEFTVSTHTAEDAASAIGVLVGQIVKSLVFLAEGKAILALVSGPNRASLEKLAQLAGAPVVRADADTVRRLTGYSIGGVPPVAHALGMPVFCDRYLMQYPVVWAAAGTPNTVFAISPPQLVSVSGAKIADICVSPPPSAGSGLVG